MRVSIARAEHASACTRREMLIPVRSTHLFLNVRQEQRFERFGVLLEGKEGSKISCMDGLSPTQHRIQSIVIGTKS